MLSGAGPFCDDCGWQECLLAGRCQWPELTAASQPLPPAELESLAADLDQRLSDLATASLTGVAERPAADVHAPQARRRDNPAAAASPDAVAGPAGVSASLRSEQHRAGGSPFSAFSSASPATAGTPC